MVNSAKQCEAQVLEGNEGRAGGTETQSSVPRNSDRYLDYKPLPCME